jgi:hypothetical protein
VVIYCNAAIADGDGSQHTMATVIADSFSVNDYRAAKYLIQLESVTTASINFQITEILLLASNTGTVQLTEYASINTDGPLGSFIADIQIDNIVRLYFQAFAASDKTIYVLRTGMES